MQSSGCRCCPPEGESLSMLLRLMCAHPGYDDSDQQVYSAASGLFGDVAASQFDVLSWYAVPSLNLFGAAAILVGDLTTGTYGTTWLGVMITEAAQGAAWFGRMLATYAFDYKRIQYQKYWDFANIGLEVASIGLNVFLLTQDSSNVSAWSISNLIASVLSGAISVWSAFFDTDLEV